MPDNSLEADVHVTYGFYAGPVRETDIKGKLDIENGEIVASFTREGSKLCRKTGHACSHMYPSGYVFLCEPHFTDDIASDQMHVSKIDGPLYYLRREQQPMC